MQELVLLKPLKYLLMWANISILSLFSKSPKWTNISCILRRLLYTSLKWPEDVWTILLQSVFVGKAREIHSALPVEHSATYQIVKDAVLKAYEQVPEAYRQMFRSSTKDEKQTYVQFACEKERIFDRWCASQEVESDFTRLRELLLIEEFKNCIPNEVKTYLDENKVETLHRATTLADNYIPSPNKRFWEIRYLSTKWTETTSSR